tara:strand:+ start:418 stop:1074 length:657 start_codon:yes stop_codon:yes gene_type:complete
MSDDNSGMRPWGPCWYPEFGYVMEQWPDWVGDIQVSSSGGGVLPDAGRGRFTHVPAGRKWGGGLRLPKWGEEHGELNEREVWVNRDIVGSFVLIRGSFTEPPYAVRGEIPFNSICGKKVVLPHHKHRGPMIEIDDDTHQRLEWMFAYVSGYDSYNGKHKLVFKKGDTFYPGYYVDLDKCVFQEWTRPDMRRWMAFLEKASSPSGKALLGKKNEYQGKW